MIMKFIRGVNNDCLWFRGRSKGIIKNYIWKRKLTKRLLALGCIDNTEIEVRKIAPLGDPIVIRFRGFDLAIRKKMLKI